MAAFAPTRLLPSINAWFWQGWKRYAAAIAGIEECRNSPPNIACGVATAENIGSATASRDSSGQHLECLSVALVGHACAASNFLRRSEDSAGATISRFPSVLTNGVSGSILSQNWLRVWPYPRFPRQCGPQQSDVSHGPLREVAIVSLLWVARAR